MSDEAIIKLAEAIKALADEMAALRATGINTYHLGAATLPPMPTTTWIWPAGGTYG